MPLSTALLYISRRGYGVVKSTLQVGLHPYEGWTLRPCRWPAGAQRCRGAAGSVLHSSLNGGDRAIDVRPIHGFTMRP